jgi:succinylglutamate desuccinylase
VQAKESQLTIFDRIPDGFIDCPANKLINVLPGPSLIDLPGRDPRPLFVSILQHGNEDSGLTAAHQVLKRYASRELPRSLLLFVGNVAAAAANVRTLSSQTDFNRAWPGTEKPSTPEAERARRIFDYAAARKPLASLDIHNNTGWNPHYSCIRRLERPFIGLARLFSRTIVHFDRPLGVQCASFSKLCPAITVECGKAGIEAATSHAAELIESCLSMANLPNHPISEHDVDLLRTYAIIKVPPSASFSFDGTAAQFLFRSDLDRLNFSELETGTSFGQIGDKNARLEIFPGDGDHEVGDFFDYENGEIRLSQDVIPAMLTLDPNAIRQDCLCYFMRRIPLDGDAAQNDRR